MSGSAAVLQPEPAPIVACTISRDVQEFDLLIEDMETELGEAWGDLSVAAVAFTAVGLCFYAFRGSFGKATADYQEAAKAASMIASIT